MDLQKILISVSVAAILGGFAWVRDIDKRMVMLDVLSDDLDNVVGTMQMLHPPRSSELHAAEETFFGSDSGSPKRRKMLEQLRQQTAPPVAKGDDDDSAAPQEA